MRRAVVVCLTLGIVGPVIAQGQSTGARSTAGATGSATAQRLAFIRSRTILDSTPGYAAAESTFAREFQGMRDEVQKLQQQLDSAVQAFDQASIALSPAAKDAKRRDLQQMQERMNQRSSELDSRARAFVAAVDGLIFERLVGGSPGTPGTAENRAELTTTVRALLAGATSR